MGSYNALLRDIVGYAEDMSLRKETYNATDIFPAIFSQCVFFKFEPP